mgnify:FL=1
MVDLLSRNLYSGPRVYIRELLQNGLDAIEARSALDPGCPRRVTITIEGRTLKCRDSGVGLTEEEAAGLLSTIGASSKRDELGMARSDFLGQFGIGMLSCFMISDSITVYSRSAKSANSPTVIWQGKTEGTYTTQPLGPGDPHNLGEPGTEVVLEAHPGEPWIDPDTVRALVDEFASLLPISIEVRSDSAATFHGNETPVWELEPAAQQQWCDEHLGSAGVDIIPIDVPAAGVKGIAIVSQRPNALSSDHHTVYAKKMLVSRACEGIVPQWAYFVRFIGNSNYLRLTASREQLSDDELLENTRQAIGSSIRQWLEDMAENSPSRFNDFISIHAMGLRAVAVRDPYMLDLTARYVPLESTVGTFPLLDLLASHESIRYTRTVDQYRALADVAASQSMVLVNAGYAYDEELINALLTDPRYSTIAQKIRLVDPSELLDAFEECTLSEQAEAMDLMLIAAQAIDPSDCEVVLRRLTPLTLPALYLPDPDFAGRHVQRNSQAQASKMWAGIMGVSDPFANSKPPRLVLNRSNSLITRLIHASSVPQTASNVLRGLYVQSLLAGRQTLGPKERAWAAQLLASLLDSALDDTSN